MRRKNKGYDHQSPHETKGMREITHEHTKKDLFPGCARELFMRLFARNVGKNHLRRVPFKKPLMVRSGFIH